MTDINEHMADAIAYTFNNKKIKKQNDSNFICEVPERLSVVTKLCITSKGNVYARTASGILFIIPKVKP